MAVAGELTPACHPPHPRPAAAVKCSDVAPLEHRCHGSGHSREALKRLQQQVDALAIPLKFAEAPNDPQLRLVANQLSTLRPEQAVVPDKHLLQGQVALLLGDADTAVLHLKQAVDLRPRSAAAQSGLGVALLAVGQAGNALYPLRQAVSLDPAQASHHSHFATALMMEGRVSDSIAHYRRALALSPDNPSIHNDLGTALLAQQRPLLALEHLLHATTSDPTRATFQTNLGYAYLLLGRTETAIARQRTAIELDPTLVSAWLNLAGALAAARRYSEARQAVQHAAHLAPDDPRPPELLQDLSHIQGGQKAP